jgi:hypothetical protein
MSKDTGISLNQQKSCWKQLNTTRPKRSIAVPWARTRSLCSRTGMTSTSALRTSRLMGWPELEAARAYGQSP